jgi:exodeoxyribonuclease V gamma subunit
VLHAHRSDRADDLVAMLAELIATPLDDPMTPEVVSVPTRGIERWLTQRLATRLGTSAGRQDGVCANVVFPFPGGVISGALATASGLDAKADPWLPERSVWPLLEVVEESFAEPWLAPLARHITNSETVEGSKRFASIRHVADLFDRYGVHRPDMIQRWAAGQRDEDEPRWQFELWRLLRGRIGRPSPAERLRDACQRLRDEPDLLELPPRLSMFGLTRLAASYLDVLDAVATARGVHLFLLHPSPSLWQRLEPEVDASSRFLLRKEDPTAAVPRNPLLSSWGRDAREMQLVLGAAIPHGDAPAADGPEATPTLLRRIQEDVRLDRPPVGAGHRHGDEARPLLDPDDDSIRVHSCHGRGRQVEVLRDAVLHLLEDDPSLEPRDIIVMCPDIEKFAPLIQATFGGGDFSDGPGDPTRSLEIRLADRSLRQTNPVMGVLAEVLELATARITATQVLDLAGRDPVRRRFRFSDDDLFRLEEWVNGSFVRWGFDAAHRGAFHLEDIGTNTWESGLDRILLGVAMAEEDQRLFGGILPLDDVDSGDIDLAGRMTEFVHRLRAALDALGDAVPIAEWATTLASVADALTDTTPRDAWQRSQLTVLLDELVAEASDEQAGASAVALSCDDIRSIVTDRLRGKPTRANFRTGHLTVCTLVPMRSIPHRVVCLLGLDDGGFPRHMEKDGDDLTVRAARVGDRDLRSEDRQLLLDALLAARDHLVVTYTGRDERTNLHRPPAVPVGELLDVVDHTVRAPAGPARDAVVVAHPLQPFDAKNFVSDRLVAGGPWSFDRLHLDGARAALTTRQAPPAFLDGALAPLDRGPVRLDDLERFLRHPVRAFLRERLGISLRSRTREFEDAIPIELDGLEKWDVAERVLQAQLAGADQRACLDAEVARGGLPPGQLADPLLDEITAALDELVRAGQVPTAPTSLEVQLDLAGGDSLEGTVAGVRGDVLHTVAYSRLGPPARLIAWARLLALTAAFPDRAFEACTIGRARTSRATISVARVGVLDTDPAARRDAALKHLDDLVDLYRRGMCAPLPLYARTSAAWAEALGAGKDPATAARAWTSEFRFDKEDREPEHLLVLGGQVTFEALQDASGAPATDEASWVPPGPAPTRFAAYAHRLWDGLLAHEQVVDR